MGSREVLALAVKTTPWGFRKQALPTGVGAENVFPQGVLWKTGKTRRKSWLSNHTSQIRNVSLTI